MNDDFFRSYQTAEWQRLKNRVLERDNYTCQICGENHGLMHVHHITYRRCNGKAYNAPLGDLITLCEKCHYNDDGDHKHFFDGAVVLSCGFFGKKPCVSDYRKLTRSVDYGTLMIDTLVMITFDDGSFAVGCYNRKQGCLVYFSFVLTSGKNFFFLATIEEKNIKHIYPLSPIQSGRLRSLIQAFLPNSIIPAVGYSDDARMCRLGLSEDTLYELYQAVQNETSES